MKIIRSVSIDEGDYRKIREMDPLVPFSRIVQSVLRLEIERRENLLKIEEARHERRQSS